MTQEMTILARLESEMSHLARSFEEHRRNQDERWRLIEPLLLERSGDLVRGQELKADVDALGGKLRQLTTRVERLESWRDRVVWLFLGGVAVVQFLAWLLPFAYTKLLQR